MALPFQSFDYHEPSATLSELTSEQVTADDDSVTLTSPSGGSLEINTAVEVKTGVLKLNAAGMEATTNFKVSNIQGSAHGLGVGVLHYNTGTSVITYSTN